MKAQEETNYNKILKNLITDIFELENQNYDFSSYYNYGSNIVDLLQSVGIEKDFIRDNTKENQELEELYHELKKKSKLDSKYNLLKHLDCILEGVLDNTGLKYNWEEKIKENEFDVHKTIAHDFFQNLNNFIEINMMGEND